MDRVDMEANIEAYITAKGTRARAYQRGQPTKPFKKFVEERIRDGATTWFYDPIRAFNPEGRAGRGSKMLLTRVPRRQQLVGQVFRSSATEHVRRYEAGDPALRSNTLVEDIARSLGLSGNWRVLVSVDGDVRFNQTNEMNTKGLETLHQHLMANNSDFMKWNENGESNQPVTITFTKEFRRAGRAYTSQAFRDGGDRHCVLDSTADLAEQRRNSSDSTTNRGKFQTIINRIRGKTKKNGSRVPGLLDLDIYKGGVQEDKLQTIADILGVGFDISFPFLKEKLISVRPDRDPMMVIPFINWRVNHVDILPESIKYNNGYANDNHVPTILSRGQLYKKWCELKEGNIFCWAKKSATCVSRVTTMNESWAMDDNGFRDWVKEFEKETGLNNCYFNATKNPEVAEFIRAGQHYNGTIDFHKINNDNADWSGIYHYDQAAAYISYKKVDGYAENLFPSKITDYRKTDRVVGPGLYRIVDLDWTNAVGNLKSVNDITKIFLNGNIYPSPDLWRLKKRGVGFKITHGAWATTAIDVDMSAPEWNKKIDGLKFYCLWIGSKGSFRNTRNIYLAGENKLIDYLANSDLLNVFDTGDEASLCYKNHQIRNIAHFNAFITSYQRCAMLDQLEVMDITQVERIVVDGIYTTEANAQLTSTFRGKDDKMTYKNVQCGSYISAMVRDDSLTQREIDAIESVHCIDPPTLPTAEYQPLAHTTLDKGPGGNGKTYKEIKDEGHVGSLYIGPYHLLAGETAAEYDRTVSIHARLFNPLHRNMINSHNVLLIDECSMLTEDDARKIIDTFPFHKIIFMGDIGYQCEPTFGFSSGSLEEIKDFSIFDRIVPFTHDYRALCPTLRALKKRIRDAIDNNETYVPDKRITHGTTDAYTSKDIILAYKNKHCAEHTAKFAALDKFRVLENKNGLYNGQIILKDVEGVKTERRHGFTCHCVQGRTMLGKIFIDLREIKNMRMLYVAVSRARWASQIVVLYAEKPLANNVFKEFV
jgi:hypothetical protein